MTVTHPCHFNIPLCHDTLIHLAFMCGWVFEPESRRVDTDGCGAVVQSWSLGSPWLAIQCSSGPVVDLSAWVCISEYCDAIYIHKRGGLTWPELHLSLTLINSAIFFPCSLWAVKVSARITLHTCFARSIRVLTDSSWLPLPVCCFFCLNCQVSYLLL